MQDPRGPLRKFYDSMFRGAPLNQVVTIRVSKPMAMSLRTKAIEEKTDVSGLCRRYLALAATEEGLNIKSW